MSASSSQISYFVYLSSEENCRVVGRDDLSSLVRYKAAMSVVDVFVSRAPRGEGKAG